MKATIFTLTEDAQKQLGLVKGSALIGRPTSTSDTVLVYFEGNIHGAFNLHAMSERVKCAAGRLFDNYPTTAKMGIDKKYLKIVGYVDQHYQITVSDKQAYRAIQRAYEPGEGVF